MGTSSRIKRALNYIDTHLGDDDVVAQAVMLSGYSPGHFARLFRQETKSSTYRYVRSKRLEVAKYMLVQSSNRIIDIAMELGFGSHQDFTRAFSAHYGMSPSMYRKLGKPRPLVNLYVEQFAIGF